MHKPESYAKKFIAAAILLIAVVLTPAMAVPGTVSSGQVVELTPMQVELLKARTEIYFVEYPPKVMPTGLALIKVPWQFGGGFLVGTPSNLAAGLNATAPAKKVEAKTIADGRLSIAAWKRKRSPPPAAGGWFADIYLGAAIPQDEDLKVSASGFQATRSDVDYDNSFTVGGRLGCWLDFYSSFGGALDASFFQPDAKDMDVSVTSVSFLAMLRHPGQKFQPYIGVGLGLFVTDIDITVDLSAVSPGLTETLSDTSIDPGLDARGGLAIQLNQNVAIFGEYRFTYYNAEFKDTIAGVDVTVETDYKTHHLVAGVSYRF